MGESGVGKSTLLNIIAGLEAPDTGKLCFDGLDLLALADDALTKLRSEQMGFVFQAFHVLPYLSVAQNTGLPLALVGTDPVAARERVAEMLEAVGLADRGNAMPRELSGGELQRVAIARALVHRPRLVLADEPTGNLDPDLSLEVMRIFRRFNEVGVTLLIASHDIALIDQLGCRRIALENGALAVEQEEDPVAEYVERLEAEQGREPW